MKTARRIMRPVATCAVALLIGSGASVGLAQPRPWATIGRVATPAEVQAWDIDVRSDFKGLPPGSGTVAQGQQIWDAKCAMCHGVFGESNDVFTPIIGGTTKKDIEAGRVESLTRPNQPHRTTMMRLTHLSTLWDYIHRAMPWTAPKSLAPNDVYAVTAYMLSLADVVPDDFTLSNLNIADVEKRLPNRDGKVFYPKMWDAAGSGDTANTRCMKNCPVEGRITSVYPDSELGSHGNLAEQSRLVGAVRGIESANPAAPPASTPSR